MAVNPLFSQFQELPTELRTRIWKDALDNATAHRTIRVAVHSRFMTTDHSCLTVGGTFCGHHGKCDRYQHDVPEPKCAAWCMVDGYFASSDAFPDPEEPSSRSNLLHMSLACHESREVVTKQYPKLLQVYHGMWHKSIESRLVRYNPAIDVLLIISVPAFSNLHSNPEETPYYAQQLRDGALDRVFPQDSNLFAGFRDIVSSFEHVAFHYLGNRRPEYIHEYRDVPEDPEDFVEDYLQHSLNPHRGLNNTLDNGEFPVLLMFFESMKHLFVWPNPVYWPEFWENVVRVDKIQDLKLGDLEDPKYVVEDAEEFSECFQVYLQGESDYPARSEEHWTPNIKLLDLSIGCYASGTWLPADHSYNASNGDLLP